MCTLLVLAVLLLRIAHATVLSMHTTALAHYRCCKSQGRLDQALAHYSEAISIDPNFADAWSNMGNVYKDQQRLPEAVRCYTQVTALSAC
jgi:tetratricopeptide (TPR) repeat protein